MDLLRLETAAALWHAYFDPTFHTVEFTYTGLEILCTLHYATLPPRKETVRVTDVYLLENWTRALDRRGDHEELKRRRFEFLDSIATSEEACAWIVYSPEDTEILFERILDLTSALYARDFDIIANRFKEKLPTGMEDFLDRVIEPSFASTWCKRIPSDRVIFENRFPQLIRRQEK